MSVTLRSAGAAVAALALVLGVTACSGNSSPSTSASTGGKAVKIAYLSYTQSTFTESVNAAANEALAPTGGSSTAFSADFDPQKQNNQCQDAVTSGRYNAIILSAVDPASATTCVSAAFAAGIPVATLETAVGADPYSLQPQLDGVVAVAGSGLEPNAVAFAQLVKEACGTASPCKIAKEVASPTDRWSNDLTNAVEAKLGAGYDFVRTISTNYDPGEVSKQLPEVLTAVPDLNVFYFASDVSAVAAVPVLAERGLSKQVQVVGNGGSKEGAAALVAGQIFGTVGTWPKSATAVLVQSLTQALNGETVTQPSVDLLTVQTPYIFTQANATELVPQW